MIDSALSTPSRDVARRGKCRVSLYIGSPTGLGRPAAVTGEMLSGSVEALPAYIRLARNISHLRSGITDFCNDVGTVNSCRTQANTLRREAAKKSASALVDGGNVAQEEMGWSALCDRLRCTGLDRALRRGKRSNSAACAVEGFSTSIAFAVNACREPAPFSNRLLHLDRRRIRTAGLRSLVRYRETCRAARFA
jgi:hypothetical protein